MPLPCRTRRSRVVVAINATTADVTLTDPALSEDLSTLVNPLEVHPALGALGGALGGDWGRAAWVAAAGQLLVPALTAVVLVERR